MCSGLAALVGLAVPASAQVRAGFNVTPYPTAWMQGRPLRGLKPPADTPSGSWSVKPEMASASTSRRIWVHPGNCSWPAASRSSGMTAQHAGLPRRTRVPVLAERRGVACCTRSFRGRTLLRRGVFVERLRVRAWCGLQLRPQPGAAAARELRASHGLVRRRDRHGAGVPVRYRQAVLKLTEELCSSDFPKTRLRLQRRPTRRFRFRPCVSTSR
jgi:hypothetical protein